MEGGYRTYPEYKDSGVEWLGEVPKDWMVSKIGFLSIKTGSGKTPKGGSEVYSDNGILFLRSQNVYDTGLKLDRDEVVYISEKIDSEMEGSRVREGDILLNITGASIGRSCIVPIGFPKANVNQHVCIIRINENLREYVSLYLKSQAAKAQIDAAQNGAAREGLNFEQLSNILIALPNTDDECRCIANFLDHETAKIDILIEKQQQLITLLKEKRQAVISHAVTKGLNPDAPMKDSGVEWLGEVPEHWTVSKGKYLFDFITSGSRGWASFYSEKGALFFRIANLTRDTINPKLESVQRVSPPRGSEGERAVIKINDLLVSITADLGSVCVADESMAGGYVSQHVSLCRPSESVNSARWLAYYILSDISKEQLLGAGYGGTKIQLSLEDIRDIRIAKPPADEQISLRDFIDNQMNKFHNLINKAEIQINLLQERRTALISAAVTGKIDVRNWQPPTDKDIQ